MNLFADLIIIQEDMNIQIEVSELLGMLVHSNVVKSVINVRRKVEEIILYKVFH